MPVTAERGRLGPLTRVLVRGCRASRRNPLAGAGIPVRDSTQRRDDAEGTDSIAPRAPQAQGGVRVRLGRWLRAPRPRGDEPAPASARMRWRGAVERFMIPEMPQSKRQFAARQETGKDESAIGDELVGMVRARRRRSRRARARRGARGGRSDRPGRGGGGARRWPARRGARDIRGRGAGCERRAARPRRRALRRAPVPQGPRLAHGGTQPGVGLAPDAGQRVGSERPARRELPARRPRSARALDHARVRDDLRHVHRLPRSAQGDAQSLEPGAHPGRLFRGLRRPRGSRGDPDLHGLGRRRLDPNPRLLLRPGGAEGIARAGLDAAEPQRVHVAHRGRRRGHPLGARQRRGARLPAPQAGRRHLLSHGSARRLLAGGSATPARAPAHRALYRALGPGRGLRPRSRGQGAGLRRCARGSRAPRRRSRGRGPVRLARDVEGLRHAVDMLPDELPALG